MTTRGKPAAGHRGIYEHSGRRKGFTIKRVEGNLCWAVYDGTDSAEPFIWRFKDHGNPPQYTLNDLHHWPGKPVICNGYEGAIATVHSGQLEGMADVRLSSGVICVSVSELEACKV